MSLNQPALGRGTVWRPLGKREHHPDLAADIFPAGLVLFVDHFTPDDPLVLGGGPVPGHRRCSAVGLSRGDCRMPHLDGGSYCYYHDKVHRGLIDTFFEERWSEADDMFHSVEVRPQLLYPVWPLPATGYVLLAQEAAA